MDNRKEQTRLDDLSNRADRIATLFFDRETPAYANLKQCIFHELTWLDTEVRYALELERKDEKCMKENPP